jgi:YD repeat-containing protein
MTANAPHSHCTAVQWRRSRPSRQGFTWDALGRRIAHVNDALGITTRYFFDGVTTLDATGDSVADREVGERRAFAVVSRASELAEYADNGTGNGSRSRYYVHGVSYVDERLMMYDDDTDRPYYYVTDRMHNVRVLVDRAGAIRERYAYDPYGRPLIRELCGRGDMNDDTRMTTSPDDARFEDAEDDTIWDPRADLDDDGDVDGDDVTAYHNKKPTWNSVMSAPTVSQAFSDFDNPFMFQGVPHFALDTAANATAEQLNLALNHHRARFADAQVGRWATRDPLVYNKRSLPDRDHSDRLTQPQMPTDLLTITYRYLSAAPTHHFDPSGLTGPIVTATRHRCGDCNGVTSANGCRSVNIGACCNAAGWRCRISTNTPTCGPFVFSNPLGGVVHVYVHICGCLP